jgi:hypothetical protein
MKIYWCLPLFVVFSLPLAAQQPLVRKSVRATQSKASSGNPGVASPSREQVLTLLDLLKVRDTIKITLDATRQQVQGSAEETFREKVPNPSPEQLKSLRAVVDEIFGEISLEEIVKNVVPVYQRHLTKADVTALITFYSSPVGQKVLREQPAMVRESMEATAAGQQHKMESLMARLELRVQQLAVDEQNKNATDKK